MKSTLYDDVFRELKLGVIVIADRVLRSVEERIKSNRDTKRISSKLKGNRGDSGNRKSDPEMEAW